VGQAVDYIIDSLLRLPLDENEKITFLLLADQLRNQVKMLSEQADQNTLIPLLIRWSTLRQPV
jgi:hypothetical protein